jgi:hypothetical protein
MEERRRSQRKNVRIEAEIISEDNTYSAIIENISEHGLCLETSSDDLLGTSTRFHPGAEFDIKFQPPSGDMLTIRCKIIWSYKVAPHGLVKKIGMEVIFPPPEYVDFYKKL